MSLLVKPNSNTPFGVSQRIIRENKGWKWLEILLSLLQWLYLQHIFFQDVKNPFFGYLHAQWRVTKMNFYTDQDSCRKVT